ncbi:hypothetical protein GDO81_009502 [Engystomops pustulosus]|uniref:Uncharacterized protein n=1 Tax=Engystomops pustulosus TaxID=76066 RepID=A0AAV7BRP6_ENGPU|nr:hypothetical protein GDO81_009502 [Engystomops pustulosus]
MSLQEEKPIRCGIWVKAAHVGPYVTYKTTLQSSLLLLPNSPQTLLLVFWIQTPKPNTEMGIMNMDEHYHPCAMGRSCKAEGLAIDNWYLRGKKLQKDTQSFCIYNLLYATSTLFYCLYYSQGFRSHRHSTTWALGQFYHSEGAKLGQFARHPQTIALLSTRTKTLEKLHKSVITLFYFYRLDVILCVLN